MRNFMSLIRFVYRNLTLMAKFSGGLALNPNRSSIASIPLSDISTRDLHPIRLNAIAAPSSPGRAQLVAWPASPLFL